MHACLHTGYKEGERGEKEKKTTANQVTILCMHAVCTESNFCACVCMAFNFKEREKGFNLQPYRVNCGEDKVSQRI